MPADEPSATLFSFHAARNKPARAARNVRAARPAVPAPPGLFDLPEPAAPSSVAASEPTPAPRAAVHIYTVRELIAELRVHVEGSYAGLLQVEGEISNCRPAASGHLYFTLKDGEAQLPVVLFRRNAQALGFKPRDGMAVEVRGRVSLYETRGQLQLMAESLRPHGVGALQLAFEQLRDRLRREGLFDRVRTPLPAFPQCIGIVTSPTGAALRDIIQVVRRRHACLNLLIYPAVVQGAQCPSSVAAGIAWFNRHPERVDLILIARGGGSLEDLAGFNDEALARAIAGSTLPVVSAIGHEVDSTIADFVADLRAPTPSAAAELITAAQHRIEERVQGLERRVQRAGAYHLMRARQRLDRLSAAHVLARLRDSIGRREQRVDELRFRMDAVGERRVRRLEGRLAALAMRLHRNDPASHMVRAQGRLVRVSARLERVGQRLAVPARARLTGATLRLHALSPLAVLSRGYALVYAEDGTILRAARMAEPGREIRTRLADGSLRAVVLERLNSTETVPS